MQWEITSGSLRLEDGVKKLLSQWDCGFPLRQVPVLQSSQTRDLCEKSNIKILFPFEMCLYYQGKDISGIQPARLPWLQCTLHISLQQEKELRDWLSVWQIFAWIPAPVSWLSDFRKVASSPWALGPHPAKAENDPNLIGLWKHKVRHWTASYQTVAGSGDGVGGGPTWTSREPGRLVFLVLNTKWSKQESVLALGTLFSLLSPTSNRRFIQTSQVHTECKGKVTKRWECRDKASRPPCPGDASCQSLDCEEGGCDWNTTLKIVARSIAVAQGKHRNTTVSDGQRKN